MAAGNDDPALEPTSRIDSQSPLTGAEIAALRRHLEFAHRTQWEAASIAAGQPQPDPVQSWDQESIAQILCEANHHEHARSALSAILRLLCGHTGFAVGHVWRATADPVLMSMGIWEYHPAQESFAQRIRTALRGRAMRPGIGLAGSVLSQGVPLWIDDATTQPDAEWSGELGVACGFAFPVRSGQRVLAVLEFLDPAPRRRDDQLLELCRTVGAELGRVFEREQAAARQSEHVEQLEASAAARTSALIEARDAAQAAARAKDSFLATVSHELSAPLHNISCSLDAIAAAVTDPAVAAHVSDAQASAQRLATLGEHLLVVAEAESNLSTSRQLHLVKPVDLLAEAFGWVYDSCGNISDRVRRRIESGAERAVMLNDALVVRALAALLENAVRHTNGPIVLYASAEDSWLTFGVINEVAEISAQATERMNEPFTMGTPISRELGLGLAVANRLAHQLGGQLTMIDAPDGGTDVRLVIPAARLSSERHWGLGRVLLVDDVDVNRRLTMAMLKRLGVACDEVLDGYAALAALSETPYALVIMNTEMPGIDGCETTRRWRNGQGNAPERASRRDVPIVAVTAHHSPAERDACLAAGMDDFIARPFTKQDLREMILRWSPDILTGQAANAPRPARDPAWQMTGPK